MEEFPLNKDLKLAEQLLHRNSRLPPEIRTFSNKLIYTSKSQKRNKNKVQCKQRKETAKIGADTNKIQAKKNKRSMKLKVFFFEKDKTRF